MYARAVGYEVSGDASCCRRKLKGGSFIGRAGVSHLIVITGIICVHKKLLVRTRKLSDTQNLKQKREMEQVLFS